MDRKDAQPHYFSEVGVVLQLLRFGVEGRDQDCDCEEAEEDQLVGEGKTGVAQKVAVWDQRFLDNLFDVEWGN